MTTLDLHEAANLLHIHPVTLRDKARQGEIPGAKIGKSWVFIELDLIEHIRSQYPLRVMQGEQKEKSLCHSTNAMIHPFGGLNSATTDKQYKEALGLMTE